MKIKRNIRIYSFAIAGVLLILSGGCKKNTDNTPAPAPQVPVFTVIADTVLLQTGGKGLQFFGKCTNEDIKMTKVMVTSPVTVQTLTYNLNGTSFVKNTSFPMQDNNSAYNKEPGIWKFNLTGNRTADNASFTADVTLSITGK